MTTTAWEFSLISTTLISKESLPIRSILLSIFLFSELSSLIESPTKKPFQDKLKLTPAKKSKIRTAKINEMMRDIPPERGTSFLWSFFTPSGLSTQLKDLKIFLLILKVYQEILL